VLILTTAALTVLSIWHSTSGLSRLSTAGGGCHHVMSLWVQGTQLYTSFSPSLTIGFVFSCKNSAYWGLFLAGVANTLLWHTGMPSMFLEETMGEYFGFPPLSFLSKRYRKIWLWWSFVSARTCLMTCCGLMWRTARGVGERYMLMAWRWCAWICLFFVASNMN